MSHARRIIVLLPPAEDIEHPGKLLQAAADLAGNAALDIIAVRRAASAPHAAQALNAPSRWWHLTVPDTLRADTDHLMAAYQAALTSLNLQGPALLLLPAGALGEECAARLAMRLGGHSLGRCVDIQCQGDAVHARRHAFGGRVELGLSSQSRICLATWRPAHTPSTATQQSIEEHSVELQQALPAAPDCTPVASSDSMPALEGARLVVSGGRGMQGEAGFALLGQIAQQLGAALGGSLPTVDAGWVSVSRQIGQSGKFVAPHTYFAVAMSGTPQHMAGVSSDSRIIAVNKDPEAPIFKLADVGVVADWQELLPLLQQSLSERA